MTRLGAFLVPFLAHAFFVYYHFYDFGAYLHDSGLFASIMWRSGWELQMPAVLGGPPHMGTHFTPILSAISLVTEVLPLNHVDALALFLGTSYGLVSLAVFLVLQRWYAPDPGEFWWPALVLAMGLSFSALSLVIASYPHIEVSIVAFHLLFYYAFFRRRWALAALFFVLAWAAREDSGFQFTAVFGLLWLWSCLARRGNPRQYLAVAALGFAGSCLALFLTKYLFPGSNTVGRVYLGDPPWGHVDADFLLGRAVTMLRERVYLWLPLLYILGLSVWQRRPVLAIGVLAFGPWFVLHWLAHSGIAGTLAAYYAYPYLLSFAWVLLAPLVEGSATRSQVKHFAVVLALGWLGLQFGPARVIGPFLSGQRPQLRWFVRPDYDQLAEIMPKLGRVGADAASISLAPKAFPAGSWLQREEVQAKPDVYFWFDNPDYISPILATMSRPAFWRLSQTPVVMVFAGGKAPPEELLPRLVRVSALKLFFRLHRLHLGQNVEEGYLLRDRDGPSTGCSAHFVAIQPGKYRARFTLKVGQIYKDKTSWWLHVLGDGGRRTLGEVTVPLDPQKSDQDLEFEVPPGTQMVEIVVELPRGADLLLKDFELHLHGAGAGLLHHHVVKG